MKEGVENVGLSVRLCLRGKEGNTTKVCNDLGEVGYKIRCQMTYGEPVWDLHIFCKQGARYQMWIQCMIRECNWIQCMIRERHCIHCTHRELVILHNVYFRHLPEWTRISRRNEYINGMREIYKILEITRNTSVH